MPAPDPARARAAVLQALAAVKFTPLSDNRRSAYYAPAVLRLHCPDTLAGLGHPDIWRAIKELLTAGKVRVGKTRRCGRIHPTYTPTA